MANQFLRKERPTHETRPGYTTSESHPPMDSDSDSDSGASQRCPSVISEAWGGAAEARDSARVGWVPTETKLTYHLSAYIYGCSSISGAVNGSLVVPGDD